MLRCSQLLSAWLAQGMINLFACCRIRCAGSAWSGISFGLIARIKPFNQLVKRRAPVFLRIGRAVDDLRRILLPEPLGDDRTGAMITNFAMRDSHVVIVVNLYPFLLWAVGLGGDVINLSPGEEVPR